MPAIASVSANDDNVIGGYSEWFDPFQYLSVHQIGAGNIMQGDDAKQNRIIGRTLLQEVRMWAQ